MDYRYYLYPDKGRLVIPGCFFQEHRRLVDKQKNKLVIDAFLKAVKQRKPSPGLIVHSDRGSQYCSKDFKEHMKVNGCLQSMSSTGNCYDNAITESFFHTLKTELIYHEKYATRDIAR